MTANVKIVKTLSDILMTPALFMADKMDIIFVSKVLERVSTYKQLYRQHEVMAIKTKHQIIRKSKPMNVCRCSRIALW